MEQSAIDFFIVCQKLSELTESLLIDEKREYAFQKYSKVNNMVKVTESDHNILLLLLKYKFNSRIAPKRIEVYNFKNKSSQLNFHQYTNNSRALRSSLKCKSVKTSGKLWIKALKNIIIKHFRKVKSSLSRFKKR